MAIGGASSGADFLDLRFAFFIIRQNSNFGRLKTTDIEMSKIPFLEIPIKTTLEDCNFEGEISRFIEKEFQEDANGNQKELHPS